MSYETAFAHEYWPLSIQSQRGPNSQLINDSTIDRHLKLRISDQSKCGTKYILKKPFSAHVFIVWLDNKADKLNLSTLFMIENTQWVCYKTCS